VPVEARSVEEKGAILALGKKKKLGAKRTMTAAGYARLASIWKMGSALKGSYSEYRLAPRFL
jgi:hypothetical protein